MDEQRHTQAAQDDSNAKDQIELKDLHLSIEHAQLQGWLYEDAGGEPRWSIEVRGREHRFGSGDFAQDLAPRFYDESLPLRIDDWRKLEGQRCRFRWQDDEGQGDSLPSLYLCSHLSLPLSELELGARQGTAFALQWSGLAEADWDEDYGRDMPFRIAASIAFAEQEVRFWQDGEDQDLEAAARAIMRRRGLSGAQLRYRGFRRFRDQPGDEFHRLVRVFFDPVG